jgi:hypothetical protein
MQIILQIEIFNWVLRIPNSYWGGPMSTLFLAKPIVARPLNRFPAFYATWEFITVLTRAPVSVLSRMMA